MKIGIFGPFGHIGRHLTSFLEAMNVEWEGFSSKDGSGLDPMLGELPSHWECPTDLDTMIYLSHSPYHKNENENPLHLLRVNGLSPMQVALKAKNAGVKKFVFFSSASVYQFSNDVLHEKSDLNRESIYSLSKIHGEEVLKRSEGLELAILRPFHVYGAGQEGKLFPELVKRIKSNSRVSIYPHKDLKDDDAGILFSLIYIEDLVTLLWKIVNTETIGTLNLSSPDVLSIREFALNIGEVLGKDVYFKTEKKLRRGERMANTDLLRKSFPEFKFTPLKEGLKKSLL